MEPHASLIYLADPSLPFATDPAVYVNGIPIASATKGYRENPYKFNITGSETLILKISLTNEFLVATAQDPKILSSGVNRQSPTIKDDLYGSTYSYKYGSFAWSKIYVPGGELFTKSANIVDFNNLTQSNIEAISDFGSGRGENGNNNYLEYHGFGGRDVVYLPNKDLSNKIIWTEGSRFFTDSKVGDRYTVYGGDRNDTIVLGDGNDIIDGGAGIDIAIFKKSYKDYKLQYGGTSASTGTKFIIKSSGGERDDLSNVEYAQFSDKSVVLTKWEFVVTRGEDGKATIKFMEDGRPLVSTSDAAYDDATPIKNGEYKAIYRINASVNSEPCIEFSDYNGKSTVVGRTAIQIHVGNTPADSEGCIVASDRSFLNKVRDIIEKKAVGFAETKVGKFGQTFYDLAAPITIKVVNHVAQPTINLFENMKVSSKSSDYQIAPRIQFVGDGAKPGITKLVYATFKVEGSADYGEDYVFGRGVMDYGNGLVKMAILPDTRISQLPIVILKDQQGARPEGGENIKIKLVDIDIYRKGKDKVTKESIWVEHKDSSDKPGTLTATEKLLIGKNDMNIIIAADPAANKVQGSNSQTDLHALNRETAGLDTFFFNSDLNHRNVDRIAHFGSEDTLVLTQKLFSSLAPGQLQSNEFKDIANGKVDADDHILYDSRTGSLFYDSDGSGKAAAVKFAVLDNKAAITHADFLIG